MEEVSNDSEGGWGSSLKDFNGQDYAFSIGCFDNFCFIFWRLNDSPGVPSAASDDLFGMAVCRRPNFQRSVWTDGVRPESASQTDRLKLHGAQSPICLRWHPSRQNRFLTSMRGRPCGRPLLCHWRPFLKEGLIPSLAGRGCAPQDACARGLKRARHRDGLLRLRGPV